MSLHSESAGKLIQRRTDDVHRNGERERATVSRQQAMIDKTEDFIRKNIAGQKTKQAQSRRKMLDKIDRLERRIGKSLGFSEAELTDFFSTARGTLSSANDRHKPLAAPKSSDDLVKQLQHAHAQVLSIFHAPRGHRWSRRDRRRIRPWANICRRSMQYKCLRVRCGKYRGPLLQCRARRSVCVRHCGGAGCR